MEDSKFNFVRWQDWVTFGARLLFIVGISAAIYVWRTQADVVDPMEGLVLAGAISLGLTLLLGATILVRQFEPTTPFLFLIIDLVFAGLYINLVEAEPILTTAIATPLVVSGVLRLGPMLGGFQALGIIGVTLGSIVYIFGSEDLDPLIEIYQFPVVTIALTGVLTLMWVAMRARYDYGDKLALRKIVKARQEQLVEMQQRASTINKMTEALTGTLNYEKILNAALDIGLMSVRKRNDQRVVSIVMLFRDNDRLYIADQRGLNFVEENRSFEGENGAIGEALQEAKPVVVNNPQRDPEMGDIGIKNMKSILVIPLRAHYDNFGVLIYGSEEAKAFPPDHVHTLHAIAMQATVALQNAVLYDSLMAEKERIVEMEEDARKSLVRDLHDVPTQTIAAVVMRLRIVRRMMEQDSPDVPTEIEEIEGMAQRASEEIRHVLFKLRPLALESQGLAAALNQLSDKMLKTYQQNLTVKVGDDVESFLSETQLGALFYLIEEAVNNARKYAEAEVIAVQIVRQKNIIAIRIADNGKGFDVQSVTDGYDDRGSFGMVNMRERAELLNGTLNLKSAPGKGTTITVIIPIDLSQAKANSNGSHSQIPATKLAASARTMMDRMRQF